jgi:Flp pilus assembly protein TadG
MDQPMPNNRMHPAARRSGGATMITVLVAMVALLAVSALAIDVGLVWAARSQVQNAADASSLAAGRHMIVSDPYAVTLTESRDAAVSQAAQNWTVSNTSVSIASEDIVYGNWDPDNRTFDTSVDLSDPDVVTGVQVTARLDGTNNSTVPAILSRIVGRDEFIVSANATAYLGFKGSVSPGEVELPIAIDCCQLKGSDCRQDYCTTIATPPNACDLVEAQDEGDNTVSCLEFQSTNEQNACWTEFDGDQPGISTASMLDIVETGNTHEVDTSSKIYLDNGTKVPVIGEINDRFLGTGGYVGEAGGVDRYAPVHSPPVPDSWVVSLPVVECQSEEHCAGGSPAQMVGVVCFELREITVTPDKIIRGRFLCPTDPLWDECEGGLGRSGGLDFGIRADIPVLVR